MIVDALQKSIIGNREFVKNQAGVSYLSDLSNKQGVNVISDEYSLVLQLIDQMGFKVLPNREVCIAGLKLAGQFMPIEPENELTFLMKIGKWLSAEMKDCFPNTSGWQVMSRYDCKLLIFWIFIMHYKQYVIKKLDILNFNFLYYFRKECTDKLTTTVKIYNFMMIWEMVQKQKLFGEEGEHALYRRAFREK